MVNKYNGLTEPLTEGRERSEGKRGFFSGLKMLVALIAIMVLSDVILNGVLGAYLDSWDRLHPTSLALSYVVVLCIVGCVCVAIYTPNLYRTFKSKEHIRGNKPLRFLWLLVSWLFVCMIVSGTIFSPWLLGIVIQTRAGAEFRALVQDHWIYGAGMAIAFLVIPLLGIWAMKRWSRGTDVQRREATSTN